MAFSNLDYSLALQEAIDHAWNQSVILVAAPVKATQDRM
jgi:hypothetical protein